MWNKSNHFYSKLFRIKKRYSQTMEELFTLLINMLRGLNETVYVTVKINNSVNYRNWNCILKS